METSGDVLECGVLVLREKRARVFKRSVLDELRMIAGIGAALQGYKYRTLDYLDDSLTHFPR